MTAETISNMSESCENILDKSREMVWIPYHDGVNGAPSISLSSATIRSKDPDIVAKGISWNNGRYLMDRANLIKWYNDGTPASRNHISNGLFMFNGTKEDVNFS